MPNIQDSVGKTFTIWLFTKGLVLKEEDPVRKLAQQFKSDIDWPTNGSTLEQFQEHLRVVYRTKLMNRLYTLHQTSIGEEASVVYQKMHDELDNSLNHISGALHALKIAWNDYEKFLAGKQ